MLPTHGAVTSVFHLANAMRHTSYQNVQAWVDAASNRSSFLSAAIDHRPTAEFLISVNLASSEVDVTLSPRLKALSRQADRLTLVAIARLILEVSPPPWLFVAVGKQVRFEFIPSADLQSLAWLRPELDQLLIDAASRPTESSDSVALGLGRAAELTVFAALDLLGASPVHVSEISDRFGYDIETTRGPARRWEVKGCTTNMSMSFHLSRNEFDKSGQHAFEWRLVQVEFAPSALTASFVTQSQVLNIRELFASDLLHLVPPDTPTFHWEASALVSPEADGWSQSALVPPDDLRLPSVDELGREALRMRSAAHKSQR